MTDQDLTTGEGATARFAPAAIEAMALAIRQAGGQEVFFAGALDDTGRVIAVRVCARGNESAVTALFEGLAVRDVVIHNHPSGNLSPSRADLDLAAMYSAHGHGVMIVNNEVSRVYVVVEPFTRKQMVTLDPLELRSLFRPDSPMARALPYYEVRPQQVEMSLTVAQAFNEERIAVIEAPTGVGKTMAYLWPAALWALANKERVVISTRTINLQEQIVFKDVPMLQRCLPEKITACLVKGRGNYLCWRKFERVLSEATLFDDEETQAQLNVLAEWAEHTEDGSREDLPFMPGRELWERVCSEADTCNMRRCPNPDRCFVGKARREVAKADLVVVNHHMLFSDLAIKMELNDFTSLAVLPAYQRLILDEAHSIEDSATEYFGISAARLGALATIARFVRREKGQDRGLLAFIKQKLIRDCSQLSVDDFERIQDLIDKRVLPGLEIARELLTSAFDVLRELTAAKCGAIGRDIKWRLTEDVLQGTELRDAHSEHVVPAVEALVTVVGRCIELHRLLREIGPAPGEAESPIAGELIQLNAYTNRLQLLANALAEGTSEELAENTVRWIEIDAQNPKIIRIVRVPLEVSKPLAESVYTRLKTIVMTSATLTVRREFQYLFNRVGLDLIERDRTLTLALESPFNFEEQALLGVMLDLPAPDHRDFKNATVEAVRAILRVSRGHAFVLFTSFQALDHTYRLLEHELRRAGITPLRQGESTRTRLLERFRSDTASVLFATDSFWEGVDVAGEALQCVILPKLPFRVPTEPVLQARAEAIEARGGNSFMQYSVPQAVIKFRQGFGRLIRRRSDWGVVVVLDQRVATRQYGRVFLESLPQGRVVKGPQQAVLQALSTFFIKKRGE
jgi:ATP-dependent DNA helicase DinG